MSLEFRCENVGVVCKGSIQADTEEDLVVKVAQHAADAHGVPELSATLVRYAVSTVKPTGSKKDA
ncbi:MAG: DUF1059 domain-containing protein [Acidimicrobiia bacterium]|nr:DUF1059 domain-containing protein [Acidimicrobiia bacterium]